VVVPLDGRPATLTFTQAGQATVTASATLGSNTITLPAAGSWVVTATSSVTISRLAYTTTGTITANVTVAGTVPVVV